MTKNEKKKVFKNLFLIDVLSVSGQTGDFFFRLGSLISLKTKINTSDILSYTMAYYSYALLSLALLL